MSPTEHRPNGGAWPGKRSVIGMTRLGWDGEAWPGGRGSVRAARRNNPKHGSRESTKPYLTYCLLIGWGAGGALPSR
jgi:hypothetical protein